MEEQIAETAPETPTETPKKPRLGCKQHIDTALAVLIAVYSLLTAGTAYTSSIADGNQEESYFIGLSQLSDANFFYARANQRTQLDYQVWGDMNIELVRSEAEGQPDSMTNIVFENLYNQLSPQAQLSFDRWDPARSEVPFDGQYDLEMYAAAENNQEEADAAFAQARIHGQMSNRLELFMLMFAVGLSFAAWASVSRRDFSQMVFTIGSIVILVLNVCGLIVIAMGLM